MSITKGSKAPHFTVVSSEKTEISLSDYSDKNLVLLFFPLAFTGTCTAELCHMRDNLSQFNNLNAEVLAVSVDSPFSLEKYKAEQGFNFPVASDFNATAADAYGSKYDDFVLGMKDVAKRSAFVIDKSGTVQYAEVLEDASQEPNYDNIVAALAAL